MKYSVPLLLNFSYVQILNFIHKSFFIPENNWQTKFHRGIKQRIKLWFYGISKNNAKVNNLTLKSFEHDGIMGFPAIIYYVYE
jgi:hypothetical protein